VTPAKLQPALVGGVAIGVLSALPVISVVNVCCCAWVVFGGGLAAYLMQQNHPEPISISDGAIAGLFAGVIGAFVGAILTTLIGLAMGPFQAEMIRQMLDNPDLPPEMRRIFEQLGAGRVIGIGFVLFFMVSLVVTTIFATLGGLFGALIFRKNAPPAIPPQ